MSVRRYDTLIGKGSHLSPTRSSFVRKDDCVKNTSAPRDEVMATVNGRVSTGPDRSTTFERGYLGKLCYHTWYQARNAPHKDRWCR